MKSDMNIEEKKLKETLKKVKEVIEKEKESLGSLYNSDKKADDLFFRRVREKQIHISNLQFSENKPYFARIDFTFDKDNVMHSIYIGKNGIIQDNEVIVTDWRSPISSLYYNSEVGTASFETPAGEETGEMSLKRQFEIDNGKLLDYYDVDLVSNDALLQKYLASNNDARLKSIVATIQKEQNDVIRQPLHKDIIVQGVAGSGKTTVALHRIAYLVYNHLKNIKQNQYLVIGPNPVFLKYINSVLPDLDVSEVEQSTFEEFTIKYINEDIKVNSSEKKVNASIVGKLDNDIAKFKSSEMYQLMLKQFLDIFYRGLTAKDLKLGNFVVLTSSEISNLFDKTFNSLDTTLSSKIEQTIERICLYISENQEKIKERYSDYTFEKFKKASTDEKDNLRNKFSKEREEINKNCRSKARAYFNKTKLTPQKIYKLFISSIDNYNIFNYKELKKLKQETLMNIKNSSYDFEDLAALIYIKNCIDPQREYNDIKQVVIDEAQDFGSFQFYVLKKALPNATFSIFGDLAQSIYDYRSVDTWEEVNKVMFNNEADIINFNKSYRTTSEIMSVGDEIAESIGLGRSDLVVRHGNDVEFTEVKDATDIPKKIKDKINEYKSKGYKTIAVISKTNLSSMYVNDDLSELGLILPNIELNDNLLDDQYNICTISNQLSKGLEFDAVILNNPTEKIYSSNNKLDMKLLYVAVTRALHELNIVYSGDLTTPLKKCFKKNQINI